MRHDPEVLSLVNAKGEEVASVRALSTVQDAMYFPPLRYGGNLTGATLWIGKYEAHDILGNVVSPQMIQTRHGLWSTTPFMSVPALKAMIYGDHADEYA